MIRSIYLQNMDSLGGKFVGKKTRRRFQPQLQVISIPPFEPPGCLVKGSLCHGLVLLMAEIRQTI